MTSKRIKFDYTKGITEEVALIPACLAVEILDVYRQAMTQVAPEDIVKGHAENIRTIAYSTDPKRVIEVAIEASEKFAMTQRFIDQILFNKEYKIESEQ